MALLAFPTAKGWGRFAKGGRGGTVYHITDLGDDGSPGQLREALEASGAREVIFDIGGTIDLAGSSIQINNPLCSIFGQSAPGDGILIKGADIKVKAPDVIIRGLRIRPGISGGDPRSYDALSTVRTSISGNPKVENVIIDHCSLSWGEDEIASAFGAVSKLGDVTYQRCIFAESLTTANPSAKQSGFLVGGGATQISIIENYFHSIWDRNPAIQCGDVEVVNNVVYNYGNARAVFWPAQAIARANWEGNHYTVGPLSRVPSDPGIRLLAGATYNTGSSIYLDGNVHATLGTGENNAWEHDGSGDAIVVTGTQFSFTGLVASSAAAAKTAVEADVGAHIWQKSDGTAQEFQDAVDARYDTERGAAGGAWTSSTDDPADVGGYPTISNGTLPTSTAGDGIPDSWKTTQGLDTAVNYEGITAASGYTHLENYLNELYGDTIPAGDYGAPPNDPVNQVALSPFTVSIDYTALTGLSVFDLNGELSTVVFSGATTASLKLTVTTGVTVDI